MPKEVLLCVDDENIILSSLKKDLLSIFGYRYKIEMAETGEEALELFADLQRNNYEIALVISDYIMPGMKGNELFGEIHKMSPQTIKIMLTGQATIEGITSTINSVGLFRYIQKPWTKCELKASVIDAIECYNRKHTIKEEEKQLLEKRIYLEQEIYERDNIIKYINDCLKQNDILSDFELLKEKFSLLSTIKDSLDTINNIYPQIASGQNTNEEMNNCIEKILESIKKI